MIGVEVSPPRGSRRWIVALGSEVLCLIPRLKLALGSRARFDGAAGAAPGLAIDRRVIHDFEILTRIVNSRLSVESFRRK
jgi:hypothetical protein